MKPEGQDHDQKSIRYALGKHKDLAGLACDCVGFANAAGGTIRLGIEDGALMREMKPNRRLTRR